jgi:hypothetical protein
MEESETNFGQIDTSTTSLLHLLLAEFELIYSNDWFMLTHPMDINTVCEVRGILVDDTCAAPPRPTAFPQLVDDLHVFLSGFVARVVLRLAREPDALGGADDRASKTGAASVYGCS